MPSRKDASTAVVTESPSVNGPASKLPVPLRFPLVVVLNLFLSALLYTLTAEYTAGEYASVSRRLNEWYEVAGLIAWRT
jgi:hypothetical protein